MSIITPSLQFEDGWEDGLAIAQNGTLYINNKIFDLQTTWGPTLTKIKGLYLDTFNTKQRLQLDLNGNLVGYSTTDNKQHNIVPPSGVSGFKYASVNGGWVVAVGTDNNLYVSQKEYWKYIGAFDWLKTPGQGVSKVWFPAYSYHFYMLDNTGTLFFAPDAWKNNGRVDVRWQSIATGVIDATVTQKNNDIWYINTKNEIYFLYNTKWTRKMNASQIMGIGNKLPSPPGSGGAIAIYSDIYNNGRLGMIGKDDGTVYVASNNNFWLSGGNIGNDSIRWFKTGITDLNKPVNDPRERQLRTMVSVTQSNSFMNQYSYTSLSNPMSNPYAANQGPSSLVTSVLKVNNNNAYPFKVLSLTDLIMMGRAMPVMREIHGDVNMYCLTFTTNDKYLPLGDVLVYGKDDPNNTWCILVANVPQYCKPIPTQDILPVASSPDRHAGYWAYDNLGNFYQMGRRVMYGINSGAQGDKRYLKGSSTNFVIGDVVVNGNDKTEATTASHYGTNISAIKQGGQSNTSFPVQSNMNGNIFRIFASLNGNYIMSLPNATQKVLFDFKVIKGYKSWGKVMDTSPFNTRIFVRDGGSVLNYVDFLPEYALAAMCGNGTANNTLSKPNGAIKPVLGDLNCQDLMIGYMSGNNYANILDKPSRDWCYRQDSNCDDNLFAFCAADTLGNKRAGNTANVPVTISTADLIKTYPNSKNEICSCFMPTDYYKASSYNSLLGQYGGKDGPTIFKQMNPESAFNIPECNDKLCHTNTAVQTYRGKTKSSGASCPSIGPICLNTVNLDLKSSKANLPINITQSNECNKNTPVESLPPPAPAPAPVVQKKVPSGTPPAPVPAPLPPKLSSTPITSADPPPKMSPALIIAIIVALIALLGGGAFFMMK